MRGGRALLLLALAQLLAAHRPVEIEESILDGVSIVSYQPLTNVVAGEYINSQIVEESESNNGLIFSPTKLIFGERSLGMPHIERVTIFNKFNRTVQLTSISGNTVHFHSSFFENKVLLPNSNTSFNVVFLGRLEGTVDSNLFIHTSEGIYKYMISGTSIPSAYRLQPLLRLNLPLNATFSPLIYIHNPHDHPIQVTEVYSAGGSIALELPGGGLEGPQTLWFLPPHTTRPIIGVRYNPSIVSSQGTQTVREKEFSQPYVTYVRFKLHGTASIFSSVLIVAVEIYVSPDGGPYTVPQFVDFGLGGTKDPPKKVRLLMGNSSPRPIRISSINVDTVDGLPWGGLRILSTARTLLPPLSPPDIHVATLNLNWKHIYDSGQCCGKIIIKTKQDQRLELPYTSQAYSGGLIMNDESVTRYLSSEPGITVVRQVLLKNVFNVGLFVTDIVLGKGIDKYFEISAFYPQDFKVNTIQHGFRIQLKSWTKSLKFESKITLITNISAQVIPVYIYNGKLDVYMSVPPRPTNKGTLDLGLVAVSSTSRATLILRNANPVNVCLKNSGTDLPGASIQLLGCAPQIPSTPDVENSPSANISACTCIPSRWCAVYIISVLAPASAVTLRGELWVATVHERLVVPVALTAANGGRLSQSDPSRFDDCFPGTICSIPLTIKSSFPVDMEVLSVDSVPSDRRLYYTKVPSAMSNYSTIESSSTILASSMSRIGWLHYDSYLFCDNKCYTGLDLNSTVGQQWLSRITLPVDTFEMDSHLANSRFNIFLNLTALSSHKNISVRVDTTQVRNHMLSMQIPLIWPKLYSGPLILEAPLTQVGSSSYIHFDIVNPSQTRPLLVQLVLEWMVSNNERIHSFPDKLKPPDCPNDDWCFGTFDQAFYFPNLTRGRIGNKYTENGIVNEVCYDKSGYPCERSKDIYIENSIHWLPTYLLPHPDSFVFTLLPGEKRNITVGFLTQYPRKISSVLYIRNNLTIIEALRLNGEGVVASLKFGNRKPGSSTPLLFDLTEKHLKDCDRDKMKKAGSAPNFTVKRTFVARNSGSIPVQVTRFFINGIECEGYGFRVLNCEPFELAQNGTHKVDIAFTPDFTLTKIQRLLILETSLNDFVNYTLVSSIPVSSTAKCAAILRRPSWEGNLLGITLFLLICIGLCVILAGCYESYKILTIMSVSLLRDTKVHPFDLRAIGQIGLSKKMESWDCCGNTLENKRAKDNIIKIPSWAFEDNLSNDESKPNVQCPKYEEFNPIINIRIKKKLNKRVSNPDTPISELPSDHEVAGKGKKIVKEQNEDNKDSWKNMFTRNGIMKNSGKYASRNNSSDSSDVNKLANNVSTDVSVDEQQKLTEGQKCQTSNYNGKGDGNDFENTAKHSNLKCMSNDSHSCEEDSSSTSTESSNNDDGDKENDNSMSSSSNKSASSSNGKKTNLVNINKKGKCISQCRDNYEGDGEDEEYDHKSQSSQSSSTQNEVNQRWTKNRDVISSPLKLNTDNDKQKLSEHNKLNSFDNPNFTKQNKKENVKNNKKREKQPFSKKRSLDKNIAFCGKSDNTNSSTPGTFNVPRSTTSTPPAISTVWENKASFSDVVARSENTFNNFGNRAKETQEFRSAEPKTNPSPIRSSNISSHSSNTNKFKLEDTRKCDTHNKADLGPIGSNYYSKKAVGSWPDSHSDVHNKQYRNTAQHVNKSSPHVEEDPSVMKNTDNNSFFLSSNSYFSGNNFNDMSIIKNNTGGTAAYNENIANNYGSIGSSLDMNSAQNMSRMQNIYNTGMNANMCENMAIGSGHVGNYDPPIQHSNYRLSSSPQLVTMFDLSSPPNLLEHPKSNTTSPTIINNGQTSAGFDSHVNPWQSSANENLNPIGTAPKNESIFEYDRHSFYTDNNSWTGSSLWNPTPQSANSAIQTNHPMTNPDIQVQPRNTENLASASDCSAAEWLWGYNSSGTNTETVDNNIPIHPQYELPTSTQSGVFHNQPQFHQSMNQPEMNNFDPYRSLSSIWSNGSTMDLWSTNQSNYERNNDLNNHDHKNNYQ